MNIRIINTPECLCRTCKLYGCEDCPRGKAEEEVMHIKQSASVEKIFNILDKKVDKFNLQISVGQGKKISKEIHKLIGK